MKRLTLAEYMQQHQQPQQPKSLSPIHFRAKTTEEGDAYNAAYQQFLKYYDKDPIKRDAFGKKLHDALYKNDADRLLNWYHHYSWMNDE